MDSGVLEEVRRRLREEPPPTPRRRRKTWKPVDPACFRHGVVLAFDQSLSHTGWVVVKSSWDGLRIMAGDCLDVTSDLTSFERTYAKAEAMQQRIATVVCLHKAYVDSIVHEMPAVAGYRTESSLIGGFLVRQAVRAQAPDIPVAVVSNQHMRTVLNPPAERDEKRHVRLAVEALVPRQRRAHRRWNEHVHDAAGLALTHLYDPTEGGP